MKNVHVCLVSDQTIPNILTIEQFKPDELLLVSTQKMEDKGKSGHVLDCLAARGLDYRSRHQIVTVAEDSLLDCHRKLEGWVQGREESDFVVNLTCGTKIMSIAAYEFFKDYGCRMIYIPIPRNEYTVPFPKRGAHQAVALPQRLSVTEYLAACGLTPLNAHHLPGMAREARQRRELAHWIVAHYGKLKNLLVWLGGALREHRDDREFFLKGSFAGATGEERELFLRMGFSVSGADLEKHLPKSEIQFLTGAWLEEYCFNKVSDYLGQGIDDVVIAIKIKNPKGADNEFDVLFTKDNALYTVECKSLDQHEDKKTEALYKVAALQKDFGLRVGSFLVSTSAYVLKNGRVRPSIAARAEHLNTEVIPPSEVLSFGQRLAEKLKLTR